jgi:hypothetical protein
MKTNQNNDQENRAHEAEIGNRKTETPEQWWASLKPVERMLARQIALMIDEVTEDKRIEIRRETATFRARFIHILKQPEKGCLSAIMLPEPSGRGWN